MATCGGWVNSSTATANTAALSWNTDASTGFQTIVWNRWMTTGTTGTTDVRFYWSSDGDGSYQEVASSQWGQAYQLSAEEIKEAQVASELRERRRKEAEERAESILTDNLNREQKEAYAARKIIPITTAKGRMYVIKKGRAGNVYRIDESGKEIEKFCIHPVEQCPDEDVMLAQLLWLRWCENEFLRVANTTRLAA